MSITIHIPPSGDVVSLTEIKNHCKMDTDLTDDDELVRAKVSACRNVVEVATGANVDRNRVMLMTTFDYAFNQFPIGLFFGLPKTPVISITSITYVDTNGDTQTLGTDIYSLTNPQMGIVSLKYQQIWPVSRWQPNAVTVRFIAGMADTFTAVAATDVLTASGRAFTNGDCVQVLNSGGGLPAGLSAQTNYYVVNVSGSTFKLSASSGGSAIDITSAGTGTQYISDDAPSFQALQAAVMLYVQHLYVNRSAVEISPGLVAVQLPRAVDDLIASVHA